MCVFSCLLLVNEIRVKGLLTARFMLHVLRLPGFRECHGKDVFYESIWGASASSIGITKLS